MFNSLSRISLSPQQNRVRALRSPQSQLIQRNDLSTTLLDPLTSSLCNPQSSNTQFRNFQHSNIIRHGSYNNDSFPCIFRRTSNLTVDETDWDWRTVDARLEETFKNCFVEFWVGTTGEETVEFYQEEEVDVFGGRGFTMALADMVAFWKVDTLYISISYFNERNGIASWKERRKYHCWCWSGWVIWWWVQLLGGGWNQSHKS